MGTILRRYLFQSQQRCIRLLLTNQTYTPEEIADTILSANLIYVGEGDTWNCGG
jgi:peptidase E